MVWLWSSFRLIEEFWVGLIVTFRCMELCDLPKKLFAPPISMFFGGWSICIFICNFVLAWICIWHCINICPYVIVCKICIREGGALHFARFGSSQLFLLPYMLPKSPLHLKCSICHFSALSPSLCPHIVTNSHEISFDLPVWAAYKILTSNCLRIWNELNAFENFSWPWLWTWAVFAST